MFVVMLQHSTHVTAVDAPCHQHHILTYVWSLTGVDVEMRHVNFGIKPCLQVDPVQAWHDVKRMQTC